MGVVSDYLRETLTKLVNDHRLLIWFDPQRDYEAFAQALAAQPEETNSLPIVCYDGSFFALRHAISPRLDGEQAPRLIVYVPLAEEQTHHALIELTSIGETIQPGQQPRQFNTRLAIIAKNALKANLSEEQLNALVKQIDHSQLTLAELDQIAERAGGATATGVIALIFGDGRPEEVALGLLDGERHDQVINGKRAQGEIAALLTGAYGLDLPVDASLDDLRVRLARHILCTELIATLTAHATPDAPLPPTLATVKVASDPAASSACVHLAERWRQSRDLATSYIAHATRVERELALARLTFTLTQAQRCHTFAAMDDATQRGAAQALRDNALLEAREARDERDAREARDDAQVDLLKLVAERRDGFWSAQSPDRRARWTLLDNIGRLFQQAQVVDAALRDTHASPMTPVELFRRYTEGERPWCELDTLQRELEQHAHYLDLGAPDAELTSALALARRRYRAVASTLAERFTHALANARFHLAGVRRQRATFADVVAPALRKGKTAYVLVDALRYEMARQLAPALEDTAQVTLTAAVGTPPTITEIGMAALLPSAEHDARVIAAGASKLALELDGEALRDRKSRLKWLAQRVTIGPGGAQARVMTSTLDDLLTLKHGLKTQLETADLVVITSQEIDAVGESDNTTLARTIMETLLSNLSRGLRKLGELGCRTIVVAADHGYLFGDELDTDMKIDPPAGGEQFDLHRRVWVGRGGGASDAYLRAPLTAFGVNGADDDTELATPWGLGVFRAPGGTNAYFHGGLSLPELAIPVLTLTPHATPPGSTDGAFDWTLRLNTKSINTRFCTVEVRGRATGLFTAAPALARVEVRMGATSLSSPVSATYGYQEATGDVQMALYVEQTDATTGVQPPDSRELVPNSVTLQITTEQTLSGVGAIHLLDVTTGRELQRLDGVTIAISL